MASKVGQLKPFHLEDKREGPTKTVSETTVNKWEGCILTNIKKEEKWHKFLHPKTWTAKKVPNRGFTGADSEADATQHDMMLEYISQYARNALYRDITIRAKSLREVWTLIRNWAGLKTSGCKQQVYYTVKRSYDPNSDLSPTDFFFSLRNAKEDCLLLCAAHGGKISYQGSIPAEDEDLTPTLECDVVLDWLDAMGGPKLVENTLRLFSKDLETQSLADLRQRISDNLQSLSPDPEQADLNRAYTHPVQKFPQRSYRTPPTPRPARPPTQPSTRQRGQTPPTSPLNPPCKLCLQNKPEIAHTHGISSCYQLNQSEKKQFARAILTDDPDQEYHEQSYPFYNFDTVDEEEILQEDLKEEILSQTSANACLAKITSDTVIRINRVNIYESPILACTGNSRTIYVLLDTGATASIITQKMASLLNLHIYKTGHRAVQVDGESQLPVLGEVHTSFNRGNNTLHFSGLVVPRLGVDILAGTNFHVENDVFSRMAKGTIHIGDHCIIQSSPPSLLALDSLDTTSPQRLVKVPANTILLPGDDILVTAPPDFPPDSYVMIEPNLKQTQPFFTPTISQLNGGCLTVQNQTSDPVRLKKNCQAFSLHTTSPTIPSTSTNPLDLPPIGNKPVGEIVKEVKLDGHLSSHDKKPFLDIISSHPKIFQQDLPGYNHSFGPVYANYTFASKARPIPQKLRSPNYGSHQNLLFNQKCSQLLQQGVLMDPIEHNIQPIMTHNAWVVKKPSAASTPWDQCSVKDVRLVVGLDPLNRFLISPPGKITKTDTIYASLAQWDHMGELDFSDFYFQIKFKMESERDRAKLGYLCIRTATGTKTFTSAIQGLLGMDVYQDELTDRLLGDLVLAGHVVKLADNIYFGARDLPSFAKLFSTILSRIQDADLRIKPSKLRLNIQSADILGLHWSKGKLSPSLHKLDPLAMCEPPKTVRSLRGWLGAVRFNEVCLPGAKLALLTKLLDEQIPASRSGKEEITWTSELLHSFKKVQEVLKHPLSVTIPRPGDTLYLATDACTSIPAGGTKLFIKRPDINGFLPSFNFGCRLPTTLRKWSLCEVAAYFLNKGIKMPHHLGKSVP